MLKKENRLSTNFEYNIVRKYGDNYKGQYFHMFVLKPKNYEGPTRFGIVISTKFDKRAVKRNRTKRVFREVLRHNLDKFPKDLWIVIHPKFISIDKSYEEISPDFTEILQKVSFPK